MEKILLAMQKNKAPLVLNISGGMGAVVIYYFMSYQWQYVGTAYGKIIVACLMASIGIWMVIKNYKKEIANNVITSSDRSQIQNQAK